jgi:large subunit ribosomal protein L23
MATDLKAKYANTLVRPRVTEKASFLLEKNVYTFEVASSATKAEVIGAVHAYYNVSPQKVRVVRNPSKKVFIRGKWGMKPGVKKAYVYLKKGDKIE